ADHADRGAELLRRAAESRSPVAYFVVPSGVDAVRAGHSPRAHDTTHGHSVCHRRTSVSTTQTYRVWLAGGCPTPAKKSVSVLLLHAHVGRAPTARCRQPHNAFAHSPIAAESIPARIGGCH